MSAEEAGVLKAEILAFEDFLNEPSQFENERRVVEYRHEAHYRWKGLVKKLLANFADARAALPDVEPVAWQVRFLLAGEWCSWHEPHPGGATHQEWKDRAQSAPHRVQYRDLFTHPASEGCPKGWQPIETAPKDGAHILLMLPSAKIAHEGYWAEAIEGDEYEPGVLAGWCVPALCHYNDHTLMPTHWQPLPPAPSIPEGE